MDQLSNEITGSFGDSGEDDPEDDYARKVTFHSGPHTTEVKKRSTLKQQHGGTPGTQAGTGVTDPASVNPTTATCFSVLNTQDDCGGPKLPCPGPFNFSTEGDAWSKNIVLKDPPREEEDCATACARVQQTKDRICDVVRRRLELMLKHNGCPSRILSEAEAAYYKVPMPGAKPPATPQQQMGYMPGAMPYPIYGYGGRPQPPPVYYDPMPAGVVPMDVGRTYEEAFTPMKRKVG